MTYNDSDAKYASVPMSRISTSQDREQHRGALVCKAQGGRSKPLGVPRSELALTLRSANYTSEHCELTNLRRDKFH